MKMFNKKIKVCYLALYCTVLYVSFTESVFSSGLASELIILEKNVQFRKNLSVIIPAYNEQNFIGNTIKRAIKSCQEAQIDFEIIVVNDASTDETAIIAEKNGANVINVHNRNIGKNRNAGAKKAKFDTILFLDADAAVSAKDIRRSLEFLQNYSIVCPFYRFDSFFPPHASFMLNIYNICVSYGGPWGGGGGIAFIDRERFQNIGGYNELIFVGEDFDLLKRMQNHSFLYMDGYQSSRRFLKQGITSGIVEYFTGQKYQRIGVWYQPNFRESAIQDMDSIEADLQRPLSCLERFVRWIAPETKLLKQKID